MAARATSTADKELQGRSPLLPMNPARSRDFAIISAQRWVVQSGNRFLSSRPKVCPNRLLGRGRPGGRPSIRLRLLRMSAVVSWTCLWDPVRWTLPDAIICTPTIARANMVLPQPDSPITPSVSLHPKSKSRFSITRMRLDPIPDSNRRRGTVTRRRLMDNNGGSLLAMDICFIYANPRIAACYLAREHRARLAVLQWFLTGGKFALCAKDSQPCSARATRV